MILNVGGSTAQKYAVSVNTNADATVTATKGSQTLSATANSSGIAIFALNAGTWTITATINSLSKSTTVTVDSNKSVDLMVRLWIFNNGLVSDYDSFSVTDDGSSVEDVISIRYESSYGGTYCSDRAYDLTNYSKLYFVISESWGSATDHYSESGVCKSFSTESGMSMSASVGTSTTGTKVLDISGLRGSFYICGKSYLHITKISQIYAE